VTVPECWLFIDFADAGGTGSYADSLLCPQIDLEWGAELPDLSAAVETRGTAAVWDPGRLYDPATGPLGRDALSEPHRCHLRVADRDPRPTAVRWTGWAVPELRTDPLWARWRLRSLDYARMADTVQFPRFNVPPDSAEPPSAALGSANAPRVQRVRAVASTTAAGASTAVATVTADTALAAAHIRSATRNAGFREHGTVALSGGTGTITLEGLSPGVKHLITASETALYDTGASTVVAVPPLPLLPRCPAGEHYNPKTGRCEAIS